MDDAAHHTCQQHRIDLNLPAEYRVGYFLPGDAQRVVYGPVHLRADAADIHQKYVRSLRHSSQCREVGIEYRPRTALRLAAGGIGCQKDLALEFSAHLLITGDQQLIAMGEGFVKVALSETSTFADQTNAGVPVAQLSVNLDRCADQLAAAFELALDLDLVRNRATGAFERLVMGHANDFDIDRCQTLTEKCRLFRVSIRRYSIMTISSVSASAFDVLIVGAGLSGIGAGYLLNRDCPDKSFAILESRSAIGGTWDLFRYPGIRSDSDMYTLSYSFKPWRGRKSIVDGPDIKRYIEEVAEEGGLTSRIRFNHRVVTANWCGQAQRWSLEVESFDATGSSRRETLTCRFLFLGSGYYSYEEGYRPEFPGEKNYQGTLVHPQFWPENLDYAGKRIVVIGSGATAVTLVPALAQQAAHVTMLQRSPSYVASRPLVDRIAHGLQRFLPAPVAHGLTRWKNVLEGSFYYRIARRRPGLFKKRLLEMASQELGPDFDMRHFSPSYNPWDQRVCAVPDGDLFKDLREGRASVVTDTIAEFTTDGIKLASGDELPADIVITATGLKLNAMGDIRFSVDGKAVQVGECMAYKGMMLSGIPNCLLAFGYVNSSWTLKAELTAGYLCRLLQYMDKQGFAVAEAPRDPSVEEEPFLNFTSGYVQRAAGLLPKQGTRRPWQVYQNYMQDMLTIRYSRIDDGVLRFQPSGDKA